jgi:putative salt-induced outer membrane protein YdiY
VTNQSVSSKLARVMCLFALLLAVLPGVAIADELLLNDGSKLVGTIEKLDGGKVLIKTAFAGDLVIDAAKVKGITSAGKVNVQLESGDRVVGQLTYDATAGTQTVTGDVVGNNKPVKLAQVQRAWRSGTEDPAVIAQRAEAAKFNPAWKIRIEAGLNGQSGNTEKVNFNGAFEARRDTPIDRLLLHGLAHYSRENGVKSKQEFIGGARYEYDVKDLMFTYGAIQLENDEFENLDFRSTLTGGVGLFLIKKEGTELKVRAGLGYEHETFTTGVTTDEGVSEFGLNLNHDFSKWLRYKHETVVHPSFERIESVRATMVNAVEVPIGTDEMWKIKTGFRNQYDAAAQMGVEKLDTYYFLNLVVDF